MLLRDTGTIDDGIGDVLLLPHDAHHVGQYLLAGCVVDEKMLLVGAVADDVGTPAGQFGFVWLGVLKECAVDETLAIAHHPYLAAQTAIDNGRGGKTVDGVGQGTATMQPSVAHRVGKPSGDANAELVAGNVGRHVADILRHELHGVASVAGEMAVAL